MHLVESLHQEVNFSFQFLGFLLLNFDFFLQFSLVFGFNLCLVTFVIDLIKLAFELYTLLSETHKNCLKDIHEI